MNIPTDQWAEASGGFVQDENGKLWRIIGFIDRPAVVLDPVEIPDFAKDGPLGDQRCRETVIMGSPLSRRFKWLRPVEAADG